MDSSAPPGAIARRGHRARGRDRRSGRAAVEHLEERRVLAPLVTAMLVGSTLDIAIASADTSVAVVYDPGGDTYMVESLGLATPFVVSNALVDAVRVRGTDEGGQSFQLASSSASGGVGLFDALDIGADVEEATLFGAIEAGGTVTIGSPAIFLSADVATPAADQAYAGEVKLGATANLAGRSIAFSGVVIGMGNGLTVSVEQPLALDGSKVAEMRSLAVNGPVTLSGAVSAMESLSFAAPTAPSLLAADTILSAPAISITGNLDGNFHDLALDGAVSTSGSLYRLGKIESKGAMRVVGSLSAEEHLYTGVVSLAGAMQYGGGAAAFVNGIDGQGQDLLLSLTAPISVSDAGFRDIGKFQAAATTAVTLGTFSTRGWQLYDGPVQLTGAVALTATLVEFRDRVDGVEALSIITAGEVPSFYGAVLRGPVNVGSLDVSSVKPVSIGSAGPITTVGIQRYRGDIYLDASTVLSASEVTIDGVLFGGLGSVKGGLQVDGAAILHKGTSHLANLRVTGTASLAGSVTTDAEQVYDGRVTLAADTVFGGTTGSFAEGVDAGGHVLGLMFSGPMTLDPMVFRGMSSLFVGGGGATTLVADIVTTGSQTYDDEMVLAGDVTLFAGSASISFNAPVRSTGARLRTVTAGDTKFAEEVALGALDVALGTAVLGPAASPFTINTSFGQHYAAGVLVPGSAVLTAGGGFFFEGFMSGPGQLTLRTDQTTKIGGPVSLGSLHTDAGGTTVIETGSVRTTDPDSLEFGDAVILTQDTVFDAGPGALTFKSTVDGPFGLTAKSSGATVFAGAVGAMAKLQSLTTDVGGTVSLRSVATSGPQRYSDDT
ncbi:MAG: hypothetical protein EBR86_10470, partial [Planctomycetia bacterium]|nr:hypothetical protein [Planctomycetia bacterium]